jgi:hypothetical protein
MTSDEDLIALAQARYAADCARFHKHPSATTGEIIIMGGVTAVALFSGARLAIAYRVVNGGAVEDLSGPNLVALHRHLARRKAHDE